MYIIYLTSLINSFKVAFIYYLKYTISIREVNSSKYNCDGVGARHLLLSRHSAKFCHVLPTLLIEPTNQDFLCPAWKIAISLLTTSALATPLYLTSL